MFRLPDWAAPEVRPREARPLGFRDAIANPIAGVPAAGQSAVTANPRAGVGRRPLAGVGGQGIRLPVDEKGVAAHQVADGVKQLLPFAGLCAELDAVHDQARLELHRKDIRPVGRELLRFRREQLVVGIDFQEHGVGWGVEPAIVDKACLRSCRRGRKTGLPRVSRLCPASGTPRHRSWAPSRQFRRRA